MVSPGNDDTFFEERFKTTHRKIDEARILEHDRQQAALSPTLEIRHLHYSPGLGEETTTYLKKLVSSLLEFAAGYGLRLRDANHPVQFINRERYEAQSGSKLPDNISLPASRLDYNPTSKVYTVTVILPDSLNSGEVRINLTRTLFSKLFGEIHFKESILPLEFYQQESAGFEEITAGIPEILDLLATLEFPTQQWRTVCETHARLRGLTSLNDPAKAQKELIKVWRNQWEKQGLSREDRETIHALFREFREGFRQSPETICGEAINAIWEQDSQFHIILPNEHNAYLGFEKERPFHFLRAYANRLEEVMALAGFAEGIYQQLTAGGESGLLPVLKASLISRMRELRRDGKARPYLINELPQTREMELKRQHFPLKLVKWLPPDTPLKSWAQNIYKMEKRFTNSIYAKIYQVLYALEIMTEDPLSFHNTSAEKRLKSLLSLIRFRIPELRQWQTTIGILVDYSEGSADQSGRNPLPFDSFQKAWAYFISTMLTREFFLHPQHRSMLPQGFAAEQYMRSINRFINRQTNQGVNYFHLVRLLLLLYEKRAEDALSFLFYNFTNPQTTLRYILHQVSAPLGENESLQKRLEKLPLYRDTLFTVFNRRWQESLSE